MGIRCIALDLDRTTLDSQGHLSDRTKRAIGAAIQKGVCIVVASGRALASLPSEIRAIPGIRYAVTSNGAAIYDLHTGECLREYKLTRQSVQDILKCTEGTGAAYEAFIRGDAYAERAYVEDPVRFGATPHAVGYIQSTRTPVDGMRGFIWEHRGELDCIDLIVGDERHKQELWEMLGKQVKDIYITSSVRQLLEISYKDSGKEEAVKFILDYLGLGREELAAFGDGDNDSAMLSFAGLGIAVANASRACLDAADRTTSSCDEEGVAREVERILSEM